MKNHLIALFAALAAVTSASAQSPSAISYQAVVRNASGAILANQNVGLRLRILQGDLPGTVVYTETHTKTTSAQGIVSLAIGKGTSTDSLNGIDWSKGPFHLETSVDVSGGSAYTVLGASQLLSVPYAMYAKSAESAINDKVDDADADPANELQDLSMNDDTLKITGNNSATPISLNKYAKVLDGVQETVYKGNWSGGTGAGDSVIIATIPSHSTWHFDVVVTAHDINSNTNFRNVHREFIVYRSWTLDPVLQNLVTHYDATTGVQIEVTFGTTTNQEVFYKISQLSGGGTYIQYKVDVKITRAD